MLQFNVLKTDIIWTPSLKYKEAFPEEAIKMEALSKAIVDAWIQREEKYIEHNGKRYKVVEDE